MKIIGLTGGIGSGKSVVAKLFETMGIPVYDTDKEAKRITSTSLLIRECLSKKFGQELYQDGQLNKSLLASLIFENKENLNYVNAIVHPEVQKDFVCWKEQYKNSRCIAIESAILFESGFDKITDVSINVSAPLEKRIERIQMRDQINRKDILNRIENQMSEDERIRKADYTIMNDDCQALLPQVKKTLKQINY
jgi:dephospho-CoA kinase